MAKPGRKGVSEYDIFQKANELFSRTGEPPSNRAVHEAVGKGSMTTIANAMNAWREKYLPVYESAQSGAGVFLLRSILDVYDHIFAELEAEDAKRLDKLEERETANATLIDNLRAEAEAHSSAATKLRESLKAIEGRLATLQTKADQQAATIQQYTEAERSLKLEISHKQETITDLKTRLTTCDAERDRLTVEKSALQARLTERDAQIATHKASAEESARAHEKERAALAEAEGKLQQAAVDSAKRLDEALAQNREQQTRITELQEKASQAEAQRLKAEAEAERLSERVAQAGEREKDLSERLAEKIRLLEKAENREDRLESLLADLRMEVKGLEVKLGEVGASRKKS